MTASRQGSEYASEMELFQRLMGSNSQMYISKKCPFFKRLLTESLRKNVEYLFC